MAVRRVWGAGSSPRGALRLRGLRRLRRAAGRPSGRDPRPARVRGRGCGGSGGPPVVLAARRVRCASGGRGGLGAREVLGCRVGGRVLGAVARRGGPVGVLSGARRGGGGWRGCRVRLVGRHPGGRTVRDGGRLRGRTAVWRWNRAVLGAARGETGRLGAGRERRGILGRVGRRLPGDAVPPELARGGACGASGKPDRGAGTPVPGRRPASSLAPRSGPGRPSSKPGPALSPEALVPAREPDPSPTAPAAEA